MNDKLFLPDILKDYPRMMSEYQHQMSICSQPFGLVGNDNKLGGVFFVSDVVFGHEATFYCWVWERGVITPTTLPFVNGYIEHYAEENQLSRVVCRTPDPRLGALLERLSFKLEGRFKNGYKSGGRLVTLFQFRRLFSGGL
jgi:RimJ/RimL family protein N-acetyltransferase